MAEPDPKAPRTDFHIHASRYRNVDPRPDMTPASIVRRCAELGLDVVGLLEHVNQSPKHPLDCYLEMTKAFRAAEMPVAAFLGAELDALPGGGLSGPEDIRDRAGLDYVIGSVHTISPETKSVDDFVEDNHRLLMELATSSNGADVVGHPWAIGRWLQNRGVVEEWRFEYIPERFLRELVEALADTGKAIEINTRSEGDFDDPACRAFAQMVHSAGVKASVGSDAHNMEDLERSLAINAFLAEMGFTAEQVWRPESGMGMREA